MWSRANRRLDQIQLVRAERGGRECYKMEYIVPKEEEEAKPVREEEEEENNTFTFEYCDPEDEEQSYQFEMTLDKLLPSDESVTEQLMARQPIRKPRCVTSSPNQKPREMKQEEDVVMEEEEAAKQVKKEEEVAKQVKKEEEVAKQVKKKEEVAKQVKKEEEVAKQVKKEEEVAKQVKREEEVAKQVKREEEVAKPVREEATKLVKKEEESTFIFEYCDPEDEGQRYQFEMTFDKPLPSDESVTEQLMVRQPIRKPRCVTSSPNQKPREMKQEEDVVTSHSSKSLPLPDNEPGNESGNEPGNESGNVSGNEPGNESGVSFLRSRHCTLRSTPGAVFSTAVAKKPSDGRAAGRGRSPPHDDENVSQQPSTRQPITEPSPKRKYQRRKLETEEDKPACPILRPSNNPLLCMLCPYPGKLFKMERFRLQHVRWAHGGQSAAPLWCNLCNRRFKRKKQLSSHVRNHAKRSAKLTCPLCKEEEGQGGFTGKKGSLRKHMQRKHRGDVPHCKICKKSFLKVSAYINDLFKHTGVTPFFCSICKMYMFTEEGLKRHKLRHQNNKKKK